MSLNCEEPEWLITPPDRISDGVREWLLEPGSLTKKLRALNQNAFEVELLQHDWGDPRQTEKEQLGLLEHKRVLVRESRLFSNNQFYIFARSVLPENVLEGQGEALKKLGNQSLGDILFRDPNLLPGKRWFAEFKSEHVDYHKAITTLKYAPDVLWGRRTLYFFYHEPLLVTELFMPVVY